MQQASIDRSGTFAALAIDLRRQCASDTGRLTLVWVSQRVESVAPLLHRGPDHHRRKLGRRAPQRLVPLAKHPPTAEM